MFFVSTYTLVQAQEQKNIQNVKWEWVRKQIVITYDLRNAKEEDYFCVNVSMELDGKPLNAKSIYGDIGRVQVGSGINKRIIWNVLDDYKEVLGLLTVSVSGSSIPKAAGPSNAFLSVPLPHWGHQKVKSKNDKFPYLLTTIAIYGLVGSGVGLELRARDLYTDYEALSKSANCTDAQLKEAYDKSNKAHHTAYLLGGTGALLWIGNIVWVANKGAGNVKRSEKSCAERQKKKTSFFLSPAPSGAIGYFTINF